MAQEGAVARVEGFNIPLHSTVCYHDLLRNRRNSVIQQSVEVRTATVIIRVRPSWGPARGRKRVLRLISYGGDGVLVYRARHVGVKDLLST